jgi:hypothetical protein
MPTTAIINDTRRMLTLISLVGRRAKNEPQCGLRHFTETDKAAFDAAHDELAVALHLMVAHFAGSVDHHNGRDEHSRDTRDLPGFTLDAVTNLDDDALEVLGEMVKRSLCAGVDTSPLVLGRKWRDDVIATSWRVLLANHEDKFDK